MLNWITFPTLGVLADEIAENLASALASFQEVLREVERVAAASPTNSFV
ncbi:hypothetical protein [Segetibacter koreensis]|nr:hypothetical protein [Segetibacter koreensis]